MANYTTYTDAALLDLLKTGDERAFNEIYDRYWKLLFTVAASRLGHYGEAEEAVQDIFADLWKRKEVLEVTYSLKSFLAGGVKFKVYAILASRERRIKKTAAIAKNLPEPAANTVEDSFRLKILQQQVTMAANELPVRCRLVYQLSRESGYSNKRIAMTLSISEKTVENQMTRALHYLRDKLSPSVQGLPVLLVLIELYYC